jgi:hypothetical protein
VRLGHKGGKNGRILLLCKSILLVLRARGVSNSISFFLLIIGFKGYKLSNNTVLDNSYDNIL